MTYSDINAVNWSKLKHLRVSPKQYQYRLTTPQPDSDALKLGRMVHAGVYEPDEFAKYVVEPRFHGGMKDETAIAKGYDGGKQAKLAFALANAGNEIVAPELHASARAITTAILDDPIAGPIVVGGYNEQTITWRDTATLIDCKGRCDEIANRLVELKTTRIISERLFAAEAVRRGYLGQIAFYLDGLAANGVTFDLPPVLIAAQNEPPYDVIVYEVGPDQVAIGRRTYRECLDKLAECQLRGEWPGIAGGQMVPFQAPSWAAPVAEDHVFTMGGEAIEV